MTAVKTSEIISRTLSVILVFLTLCTPTLQNEAGHFCKVLDLPTRLHGVTDQKIAIQTIIAKQTSKLISWILSTYTNGATLEICFFLQVDTFNKIPILLDP
jgi:hypothetical protein